MPSIDSPSPAAPVGRPVLGLWPLAGVTTVGVTESDARSTLAAALDAGIRAFDTAFSYGYEGESDRYLGEALRGRRDECYVIGKVGQRWSADRVRVIEGSPAVLVADAETSLRRLGIDHFDLLMLHSIDEAWTIETSARAIAGLRDRGLCRNIGVCNVNVDQWRAFQEAVGCDAIQTPLNLIQRDSLSELIPACRAQGTHVHVYWTLMKGLLAGRISRDHVFAAGDSRPSYAIFQGEARRRVHNLLDQLLPLAQAYELSLSQLSVGWTLSQPGVTAALVGARRPDQVREIAAVRPLAPDLVAAIDQHVVQAIGPAS